MLTLVVLLACAVAGVRAVPPQDEQALVAKSREFSRLTREKNYTKALEVADDLIALARQAGHPATGAVIYNKACVLAIMDRRPEAIATAREAIASGYTKYVQFATDSDLDSLRGEPAFRALLADLRQRYGPKPLEWNPAETVAAFPLTFDAPSAPQLATLRAEFGLDTVVSQAGDDYARLKALTEWTSRQWAHSPNQMASRPDPLTILREARVGGRFICRDYAIVAAGAARAFGLPARVLNLLPADVETRSEAHSVAEVWLASRKKWVMADGQYGIVSEKDGVPLNGVELQAALAADLDSVSCASGRAGCAGWKAFILPNMHYFKIAANQRRFETAVGPQLVLVPKGAPKPRKFAGGNEEVFAGSIYISDPSAFYREPE
jgi:hypothetical protein